MKTCRLSVRSPPCTSGSLSPLTRVVSRGEQPQHVFTLPNDSMNTSAHCTSVQIEIRGRHTRPIITRASAHQDNSRRTSQTTPNERTKMGVREAFCVHTLYMKCLADQRSRKMVDFVGYLQLQGRRVRCYQVIKSTMKSAEGWLQLFTRTESERYTFDLSSSRPPLLTSICIRVTKFVICRTWPYCCDLGYACTRRDCNDRCISITEHHFALIVGEAPDQSMIRCCTLQPGGH